MSKTASYFHIVFGTKSRRRTLSRDGREKLFRFIWNGLKSRECTLLRINGVEDHVHMLIDLSPKLSISELMRQLKAESSGFLKTCPEFRHFEGWGSGYYAATIAYKDRDVVIEYIKNQEAHHSSVSFERELDCLFEEIGKSVHQNDLM